MTATQALPVGTGRRYRFNILRVLIFGVFLSVLVAACLYCKYTAIDFFHARLLEQESKTSAWILKQVSFALPWIVICLFHGLVYCKHDRHDGIVQREMFWEVLLVTVFTYLVLLPYLQNVSEEMYAAALEMGADIPQTEGKVDQTFIMIFHEWFIRMAVPLCALLLFHSVRARRERDYPETEVPEPMMTRAEYDALRANEVDTDVSNDVAEDTSNDVAPEAQTKCPIETMEENEGTEVQQHE
jgi:hypothetical protein